MYKERTGVYRATFFLTYRNQFPNVSRFLGSFLPFDRSSLLHGLCRYEWQGQPNIDQVEDFVIHTVCCLVLPLVYCWLSPSHCLTALDTASFPLAPLLSLSATQTFPFLQGRGDYGCLQAPWPGKSKPLLTLEHLIPDRGDRAIMARRRETQSGFKKSPPIHQWS